MTRARLVAVLASLVIGVGLPLAGWLIRQGGPPRCAYDGQRIEPLYRVRIVDHDGRANDFCCLRCSSYWLQRVGEPIGVRVIDEASGEELDAQDAWFVESAIVTNRVTGNNVHAFRTRAAAEEHARAYGGVLLEGAERPLQVEKSK